MKGAVRSFRDLEVWQEAMQLALACYRVAGAFPRWELYGGLTSQIRRAAVSVPSNIAEGHARPTNVYRNHLSIALGSLAELDTVLEIAMRVGYFSESERQPLLAPLARLGRRLHALKAAIGREPS